MPVYTKQTIATYEETIYNVPPEWLNLVSDKAASMMAEGKTDNNFIVIDEYHIKRVWLDQAAADEWIAYVMPLNAEYNVVITDVQILDNPSGTI